MAEVAQDQNGCRFLQKKFDEGGPAAISMVFSVRCGGRGCAVYVSVFSLGSTIVGSSVSSRVAIMAVVSAAPGGRLLCCSTAHPVFVCSLFAALPQEILEKLVDLMMDPFGNYLIQKLLDRCSEEQRLQVGRGQGQAAVLVCCQKLLDRAAYAGGRQSGRGGG